MLYPCQKAFVEEIMRSELKDQSVMYECELTGSGINFSFAITEDDRAYVSECIQDLCKTGCEHMKE